jgi:dihydroorotase
MISMSELVKLTVKNPAKSIGLEAGVIKVGQQANVVLFNPHAKASVNNKQSLYDNEELNGKVIMSFCNNKITKF